jgi:hypothetical protein
MDSLPPFLDWLHLVASAACSCERVSASQHAPDHPTGSADAPAEPMVPRGIRRVRLMPCTPALHAVED